MVSFWYLLYCSHKSKKCWFSIVQCNLMDNKSNGSDYCLFFTLIDVNKIDFFAFFSNIVKPVYPCFHMVSKALIKYQQWCLSRNIDPVTKNKAQTVSSYSNTTVLPHRRNYTSTKDERLQFMFWRCINTLPWLGHEVSSVSSMSYLLIHE